MHFRISKYVFFDLEKCVFPRVAPKGPNMTATQVMQKFTDVQTWVTAKNYLILVPSHSSALDVTMLTISTHAVATQDWVNTVYHS